VTWRITVSATAERQLARLPEKAATAVVESFETISANPRRVGKPLRYELEGLWVVRRGPYRVLYEIDEKNGVVNIASVGHRADIYHRR
jgi:mRNA-degrading endonuclease RelE of RelBE toxin-antitoxin system